MQTLLGKRRKSQHSLSGVVLWIQVILSVELTALLASTGDVMHLLHQTLLPQTSSMILSPSVFLIVF
jgi:hypothetical protein